MEIVDVFFVELHEVIRIGVFLFFVLIDIIFVLGGLISFGEWILSKIRDDRISDHDKS